jgi:hypothetical protein
MGAPDRIVVEGLSEFRRALKPLGGEYTKLLRQELKETVSPIVSDAQAAYRKLYDRGRGRHERSIRGQATQTSASVAMGGRARTGGMKGQEFGSTQSPGKRQFPIWSGPASGGRGSRGYFFYPAIRRNMGAFRDRALKAIDRVSRRAFPGRRG